MKDSGSMNGGSLQSQYVNSCEFFLFFSALALRISSIVSDATYVLKAVQGFRSQGFPVHATSIQVGFLRP